MTMKSDRGLNVVLIVDDEPGVRELLTRWLVPAGYAVHEAGDAEAAVEILGTLHVGVVLCDQAMPGLGGEWLISQIRDRFPHVAVILATGGNVPPRVSLQPGVVGYIGKPFSRALALSAVADAMIWHRVTSQRRSKSSPRSESR